MLKQKTEPEGWQSNHEGSTDKALYTQHSLSLFLLLVSFALPVDQFTAPRGLGYYASRLGVRSWPLLCQSGDYFGKDEGCFPSCSRFPFGYLPPVPSSPLPSPPFPRLYVPSSTCIRAKLSRPISLFSPPLFFLSSKVRERKKKLEKETEKDPAEAIFAD